MKKITFKEHINAPVQIVYDTMLGINDIKTYEEWTSQFNPTSTYEGLWKKGETMYFIGTDDSGKRGGMISEIVENIANKFVSIKHYGIVDGDQEITSGEQVESWAGSLENYYFEDINGSTTVIIELDVDENYLDYFSDTWPKALKKLKELAEG